MTTNGAIGRYDRGSWPYDERFAMGREPNVGIFRPIPRGAVEGAAVFRTVRRAGLVPSVCCFASSSPGTGKQHGRGRGQQIYTP